MNQMSLELIGGPLRPTVKPLRSPREKGEEAGNQCTAKAEERNPGFTLQARDFVLRYLAANGPSWGEDVVEAAGAAGIKAHDGRAWGSVFARMSGKQIRCLRADGVRRHGRGTSGARQWGLIR